MSTLGSIRYLSKSDVEGCLPPLPLQIDLAEKALKALTVRDVEMPPKIGVHPRRSAFLHAMPAWFREEDIVGIKWIAGYPTNGPRNLASLAGLIVLNDAGTGYPKCVMDGTLITIYRTAAVSALGVRLFGPKKIHKVCLIGCGVQGRAHVQIMATLLTSVELNAYDSTHGKAEELAAWARTLDGVVEARAANSTAEAISDADLVLTCALATGGAKDVIPASSLQSVKLLIPIDWSHLIGEETAKESSWFVVDDRAQFEYVRSEGLGFVGYPDPSETMGEALVRGFFPDMDRCVLVSNLGVAAVDLLFAAEVLRAGERNSCGTLLER